MVQQQSASKLPAPGVCSLFPHHNINDCKEEKRYPEKNEPRIKQEQQQQHTHLLSELVLPFFLLSI